MYMSGGRPLGGYLRTISPKPLIRDFNMFMTSEIVDRCIVGERQKVWTA